MLTERMTMSDRIVRSMKWVLPLCAVLTVFLMAAVAGAVGVLPWQNLEATSTTDCRQLSPPCPPVVSVGSLGGALKFDDQIGLVAPPGDSSPGVSSDEARDLAWAQDGHAGREQRIELAILPRGGNIPTDVLVWVVSYTGIDCIPAASGLTEAELDCNHGWTTLIDAETGSFIYGFTDA
jgi:hypothetical protein